MTKTPNGWIVLDQEAGVLSYEYTFAPDATAVSFAARLKDGTMLVISPPSRVDAGVFDDLLEFGDVGAVIPNNGFHHLGLAEWKTRFPDARFLADPAATKRIKKKSKDAPALEPIEGLGSLLGEGVSVTVVDNTKCGELWAHVETEQGHIWFASDILSNFPSLPANFFLRTFFKLTGSRAGFAPFNTALKFTVKDKRAVLEKLRGELAEHGAHVIVPSHGQMLATPGIGERAQQVLAE